MRFFYRNGDGAIITFLVLSFFLFISAFLAKQKQVQAADAYQTLTEPSIFLPLVLNKYPLVNRFGVSLNKIDTANGLDIISAAQPAMQTSWTRRDVIWSSIETEEGVRNWDAGFEQELLNANEANLRPILIIEGTPDWALKPGFTCGAVSEDKLDALGTFAYDLVKRYSAPPYNIKYWEMWNEPDVIGFLGCWGNPNDVDYSGGYYYGKMLKAVYPQIKAADPQAQVLVGGLLLDCDPRNPPDGRTCVESRFLRGILEENKPEAYFDGVAFHGYDYYGGKGVYGNSNWNSSSATTGPVLITKAKYLKELLAEYGQSQKYLVSTESAIFSEPYPTDLSILCSNPLPEVEATKAYYLIHSYAAAVAEGWRANIWYSAFGVRCSGLLQADLTPLPAYDAYQFTVQKLGDADFIKEISQFQGVKGYEYKIPGKRLWIVWSSDGAPHEISLSEMPVLINKIGEDGKPVVEANSTSPTIDLAPRFVEFP